MTNGRRCATHPRHLKRSATWRARCWATSSCLLSPQRFTYPWENDVCVLLVDKAGSKRAFVETNRTQSSMAVSDEDLWNNPELARAAVVAMVWWHLHQSPAQEGCLGLADFKICVHMEVSE
eukprot:3256150-Pyramimonas_sp.AAC.1